MTDRPVINLPHKNRPDMLENVREYWIEGVLERSLQGAVLLELGLQASDLDTPWTVRLHTDDKQVDDIHVQAAFDQLNGKMLILGDPGSGKTTTLLDLTRALIDRASNDVDSGIPVVFNLSSWAYDQKPLDQWLADELVVKYQVSRRLAMRLVGDEELILLLDGLDEVDERCRSACVKAINVYCQQHPSVNMVACSRTRDYDALSQRLAFPGAVIVQPLNNQQIETYLNSLGYGTSSLKTTIFNDPHLKELATVPLMLNIMLFAYQGLLVEQFPQFDTPEDHRMHIFRMYVNRMFERRVDNQHYTPERTLHYLKWLAGQLVSHRLTVFHIENMQATWLGSLFERQTFTILSRILFGLLVALIGSTVSGGTLYLLSQWLGWGINGGDIMTRSELGNFIAGGLLYALLLFVPTALHSVNLSFAERTTLTDWRGLRYAVPRILGVGFFVSLSVVIVVVVTGIMLNHISFDWQRHLIYPVQAGLMGAVFSGLSGIVILNYQFWEQPRQNYRFIVGALILSVVVSLALTAALLGMSRLDVYVSAYTYTPVYRTRFWFVAASLITIGQFLISFLIFAFRRPRHESTTFSAQAGLLTLLLSLSFFLEWRIGSVAQSSDKNELLMIVLLAGLAAFVGWLMSRFTDRIQSAEALAWRWHWRWSLAGASVILLCCGIFILSSFEEAQLRVNADYSEQIASLTEADQSLADSIAQINDPLFSGGFRPEVVDELSLLRIRRFAKLYNNPNLITRPNTDVRQLTEEINRLERNISPLESVVINLNHLSALYKIPPYEQSFALISAQTEVGHQNDRYLRQQINITWNQLSPYGINSNAFCLRCEYIWEVASKSGSPYGNAAARIREYERGIDPTTHHEISLNGTFGERMGQLTVLLGDFTGDPDQHIVIAPVNQAMYRYSIYNRLNEIESRYGATARQNTIRALIGIPLLAGLVAFVAGGVAGGFHRSETVDRRLQPNEGMRRTWMTIVRIITVLAAVGLALGALVGVPLFQLYRSVDFNTYTVYVYQRALASNNEISPVQFALLGTSLGLAIGIAIGLAVSGGDTLLKHGLLRLMLWRSRSIPMNYARFLDHTVERILLRKVGGGYIFIHRYLLEHIARLPKKKI